MKKRTLAVAAALLAALMMMASCSNEGKVMMLDIPSEFHGTWRNTQDPTSYATITAGDIIEYGMGLEEVLETMFQGTGVSITGFSDDYPAYGVYNFTITASMQGASMIEYCTLSLSSDGNTMTMTVREPISGYYATGSYTRV